VSRFAVSAGILLGFAVGWNVANVGAVAEQLADAYGVSLAVVGLFTTSLFVAHGLLQIPGGKTADRFGARRTGLLALGLLIVGNALLLLEPSTALAVVGRAVVGVGTGFGFVAGADYVRTAGGGPLAQGLYGGAGVGGGGVALAVVPFVENEAAWRAPYLTALALAIVVLLALALAPSDPPRARRAAAGGVARDRRLYRFAVVHAASFGFSVIVGNWVVTLLTRQGNSEELAGVVGALTLAVGILTRPLGGRVAQSPCCWTWVAASLVAAGAATAVLAIGAPLAVSVVAAAVVGLSAGIPFAPAFVGAQRTRPDAPGAAIGLVNLASVIVILVGTPLVGLTFSLPGDGRIGFAAVAALWALSAVAATARGRRRAP
jgi:NNP family nitrate/nitrite transporter-like MFS transporter